MRHRNDKNVEPLTYEIPMLTVLTTSKKFAKYTRSKFRPLVKTHGGKYYLARPLIGLFPDNVNRYVEPFLGGGSVFLNANPQLYRSAVLNDLHAPTANLWSVLRDPDQFQSFCDGLKEVVYNEEWFVYQRDREATDPVDAAVRQYCVRRMSRGGMGGDFAWSDRLRGGQPGDLNAWETALAALPSVHRHLAEGKAEVSCVDGIEVISEFGSDPGNFAYVDPPYPHSTRSAKNVYFHEMSDDDHRRLLDSIATCKARIMLSGYSCKLYDDVLGKWRKVEFEMPNHAGQGETKERRTEVVWLNY
jgi:DNA adenine methylase